MGSSPEFTERSCAYGRLEQQFWTNLNPRFAGDSAREHRNPASRNRDSTNNSWANHAWLHFAEWNSEYSYAGIELTEQFDSRKHRTAINEPKQHEYSWEFAERHPMRNFAGHGKSSVRVHPESWIVKFESVTPGTQGNSDSSTSPGISPTPGAPCPPAASGSTTTPHA